MKGRGVRSHSRGQQSQKEKRERHALETFQRGAHAQQGYGKRLIPLAITTSSDNGSIQCSSLFQALPYPTLPYPTLPRSALPYTTLSYPFPTLPYPTLPYPTLPYFTLPYLTLPYLTLPKTPTPC